MQIFSPEYSRSYLENTCLDPLLHFYEYRCKQMMPLPQSGIVQKDDWKGVYTFREK